MRFQQKRFWKAVSKMLSVNVDAGRSTKNNGQRPVQKLTMNALCSGELNRVPMYHDYNYKCSFLHMIRFLLRNRLISNTKHYYLHICHTMKYNALYMITVFKRLHINISNTRLTTSSQVH